MACSVQCEGFSSLRPECVDNACIATNLCRALDGASVPDDVSCAEWCCVSHATTSFALVLFFCLGLFLMAAGYWLRRLHDVNVRSGAVAASPKPKEVPAQ